MELEFCSFWAMQKEGLPDKRVKKTNHSLFPALATEASTFLLDQKVDKKSLTTALIDPLYFHYVKYLMDEQLSIKYFYPSFKQWSLNVVAEVGVLTATRMLSPLTTRNSVLKRGSLFH